ncbi:hypothetical protein B0H63DRAFT_554243 [Podospora didyma]|uniref:Uncharacterized protein n=1 Tax=Podospora didyma TaxID=330526 RepID=A0AAE0P4B3_9PEZI|nr:hypothetical protein B0H63DRAFT_554243 [Podospora didyma]
MATCPASREKFEIAVVCALPREYGAISCLIDWFWDEDGDPYGRAEGDLNIKTVVQYDLGRLYPDTFITKDSVEDSLGRPNKNIRNLVAMFETELERERLRHRTAFFLQEMQSSSAAQGRREASYQYPGAAQDKLFQPSYQHKPLQSLSGALGWLTQWLSQARTATE